MQAGTQLRRTGIRHRPTCDRKGFTLLLARRPLSATTRRMPASLPPLPLLLPLPQQPPPAPAVAPAAAGSHREPAGGTPSCCRR